MGMTQFVKNDADLLGLLGKNLTQVADVVNRSYEGEGGVATGDELAAMRSESEQLIKALRENLDALSGSIDTITLSLGGYLTGEDTVAHSIESMALDIEAAANQISEMYRYAQDVETASSQFKTSVIGQIRRGFLTVNGTDIFGIAISKNLAFNGQTKTLDGETYYGLQTEQTLGLYTAEGWQFWSGGKKIGWFDSIDRKLHVPDGIFEDSLQIGGDWAWSADGGLGLKYIGTTGV